MFYILFEKLTNDFLQISQNFLEKNSKILLYLLYFNVMKSCVQRLEHNAWVHYTLHATFPVSP